jgi:hypothetical protein
MPWGILRKHLITGTFICGLALLTAQWAATQTRFNVQSSGRGLQNAKMSAQINQLQAENDAQQAELDAKKPHADAALATCGVGSGTVNNKITWNASANTWGCSEETDPNVQTFARDDYTVQASCAANEVLTMRSNQLKCVASTGMSSFEIDPTVFAFVKRSYTLNNCSSGQVLTLNADKLRCITDTDGGFADNMPTCQPGEVLTAAGGSLACVRPNGDNLGVGGSTSGTLYSNNGSYGYLGLDSANYWRLNNGRALLRLGNGWHYDFFPSVFRPYANNAVHLGDSSHRWKNGYFAGNLYAYRYYQNSDRALKTDVHPITRPFTILNAIHGSKYRWKDSGYTAFGVIAQDVERVMPEAVSTDAKGIKSVEYSQLIAPLIEAVKQLKADNDNLRERVKVLEAR